MSDNTQPERLVAAKVQSIYTDQLRALDTKLTVVGAFQWALVMLGLWCVALSEAATGSWATWWTYVLMAAITVVDVWGFRERRARKRLKAEADRTALATDEGRRELREHLDDLDHQFSCHKRLANGCERRSVGWWTTLVFIAVITNSVGFYMADILHSAGAGCGYALVYLAAWVLTEIISKRIRHTRIGVELFTHGIIPTSSRD